MQVAEQCVVLLVFPADQIECDVCSLFQRNRCHPKESGKRDRSQCIALLSLNQGNHGINIVPVRRSRSSHPGSGTEDSLLC